MGDWLRFKDSEYEDEDKFLLAMEENKSRKHEFNVKEEEWVASCMLIQAKKRKGIETHQVQE